MNGLTVGLFGFYLLMVGFKGNGDKLINEFSQDAGGFLPWLIAIAVLSFLYKNDTTQPFAKPFIGLVILAFVLKNFNTLEAQTKSIYNKVVPNGVQSIITGP